MNDRIKYSIPIVLFAFTIGFTLNNSNDAAIATFFLMFGFILLLAFQKGGLSDENDENNTILTRRNILKTPYHVYYGDELNFSDRSLDEILTKRFPYYSSLSATDQTKFLERLQNFMANKVFKIHDSNCYNEMPVLISAAAIQLTFGLNKYLLPNFEFIHVYPQEFMRVRPDICFLEGNVSGQAINLSWKHFLDGYADTRDGQNVGLHEMAHALYYQTFVIEENVDNNFRDMYDDFMNDANKVYQTEKTSDGGLYSDYAVRNIQEFWAESAELFFERPSAMRTTYPRLYEKLKSLFNQDPMNNIRSLNG